MVNSNPAFDPRVLRRDHASTLDQLTGLGNVLGGIAGSFGIGGGALFHGRIVQQDATTVADQNIVFFLFNPSVVDVSHAVDTNIPDPTAMSQDDLGHAMGPMNQSVNFTLLFDRTYETWDSSKVNDNGPGQFGVYVDIQAIYNLVGVTAPLTAVAVATPGASSSGLTRAPVTFHPSGPMRMTPVYVYFSANVLRYYGFISNLDIEYTHFTQNMVPNRATVGITLQLMIDPAYTALGSATTLHDIVNNIPNGVLTNTGASTTGPGRMRAQ